MKLRISIRHVSGHCSKGLQGQRTEVKTIARPDALAHCTGTHFNGVVLRLTFCTRVIFCVLAADCVEKHFKMTCCILSGTVNLIHS